MIVSDNLYSFLNHSQLLNWILFWIGIFTILFILIIQFFVLKQSVKIYSIKSSEKAVLLNIILLFLLSCFLIKVNPPFIIKTIIGIFLLFCNTAFYVYKHKKILIKNKEIIAVVIIIFATAVFLGVNKDPMYDANLYYGQFIKGFDNFVKTGEIIENYTIWGKQFQPLIPFLNFGELLHRGTGRGIYFINLLLLFLSMLCTYEIINEEFTHLKKTTKALLGMLFAISPFVFVGTIYINPDFYGLVFFVISAFCFKKRLWWLFAYTSLIVVGCKSNMTISYLLFFLIVDGDRLYTKKIGIKQYLETMPIAIYILPFVVWMFLYAKRIVTTPSLQQGFNSFFEKTINRVYQCGIMGFRWLIILLALLCLVHFFIIKRASFTKETVSKNIFTLAIITVTFIQFFVIEFNNNRLPIAPRYMSIQAIAIVLILAFVIQYLQENIQVLIIALVVLFNFIQLFISIDPAVVYFADSVNFINGKVYLGVTRYKTEPIGIGDMATYNFEYTLWDDVLNKMFSEIEWDSDIVFLSEWDKKNRKGTEDFRLGITMAGLYDVFWDSNARRITYVPENKQTYKIKIISVTEGRYSSIMKEYVGKDRIYFLTPDCLTDNRKNAFIKAGYTVAEEKEYFNKKTKIKLSILDYSKREEGK